jgi:hypothetical protein
LITSPWDEAVDNRGGDGQVAEDVSPAGEGQVLVTMSDVCS